MPHNPDSGEQVIPRPLQHQATAPGPRYERQDAIQGLHRRPAKEGECEDQTETESRLIQPGRSDNCQAITLSVHSYQARAAQHLYESKSARVGISDCYISHFMEL